MKKLVLLIMVSALVTGSLFAEEFSELKAELQELKTELQLEYANNEEVQKKLEQVQKDLEDQGITTYTVDVNTDDGVSVVKINTSGEEGAEKPFLGITYSDMLLFDAAQIGYNYFYGIRIDTVVPGSPAYYFRLRPGDILMQIDSYKLNNQKDLGKVISYYRVGDKVTLKVFREEGVVEIPFVFGTRTKVFDLDGNLTEESKKEAATEVLVKKTKVDYGDGTIAWVPSWYMQEVTDINKIMSDLEFEDDILSEDGYLLNTIALKGEIGNGWFIGGQYSYYFDRNSIMHDWEHYNKFGILDTTLVERKVKYWTNFGGPSLDRRFVFGEHFYGELGLLIAWGQNKITVDQKIEDPVNIDFEDDFSNNIDDYYNYVSSLKMKNDFLIAQPRASFGWRVTDWLSFKAEAAYLYSYSGKGWKAERNGKDVSVTNLPDTSMDGFCISFGPWFGF